MLVSFIISTVREIETGFYRAIMARDYKTMHSVGPHISVSIGNCKGPSESLIGYTAFMKSGPEEWTRLDVFWTHSNPHLMF